MLTTVINFAKNLRLGMKYHILAKIPLKAPEDLASVQLPLISQLIKRVKRELSCVVMSVSESVSRKSSS